MTPGAGDPSSERRDPGAPESKTYGDSAAPSVGRAGPADAGAETVGTPFSSLRAELDGLRRTIDDLKARATPGEASLVAALEGHHGRLAASLASIESRLAEGPAARREAWDAAIKDTSEKVRRGAGEFGAGLGRAWEEMRAAAGKAWDEFRRESAPPPGAANPPETPPPPRSDENAGQSR